MKNLTERLDKHLQSIREEANYSSTEFFKELKDYNYRYDKDFAKLVYELLKPSVDSQGDRFIAPSFNSIKPLIIKDIKYNIEIMKEEGMDRQEAIEYLLDPTKYDPEIGNYADTSFAEMLDDGHDGKINRASKIIVKFFDDTVDYLKREIKKNYRALIQAVK